MKVVFFLVLIINTSFAYDNSTYYLKNCEFKYKDSHHSWRDTSTGKEITLRRGIICQAIGFQCQNTPLWNDQGSYLNKIKIIGQGDSATFMGNEYICL